MRKMIEAIAVLFIIVIFLPFVAVESLIMTLKGYKWNQGWSRWEKR